MDLFSGKWFDTKVCAKYESVARFPGDGHTFFPENISFPEENIWQLLHLPPFPSLAPTSAATTSSSASASASNLCLSINSFQKKIKKDLTVVTTVLLHLIPSTKDWDITTSLSLLFQVQVIQHCPLSQFSLSWCSSAEAFLKKKKLWQLLHWLSSPASYPPLIASKTRFTWIKLDNYWGGFGLPALSWVIVNVNVTVIELPFRLLPSYDMTHTLCFKTNQDLDKDDIKVSLGFPCNAIKSDA